MPVRLATFHSSFRPTCYGSGHGVRKPGSGQGQNPHHHPLRKLLFQIQHPSASIQFSTSVAWYWVFNIATCHFMRTQSAPHPSGFRNHHNSNHIKASAPTKRSLPPNPTSSLDSHSILCHNELALSYIYYWIDPHIHFSPQKESNNQNENFTSDICRKLSKSGPGAGHGGPINKNLPLFLCLLIKN
jgi:hypothetical protein